MLETPNVERVIRDTRILAVSFTGSGRGRRAVAAIAASEIKPAVLELGGSAPRNLLAEADLDMAAAVFNVSHIVHWGHSCIASQQHIIKATLNHEIVERLRARL